MCFSAQIKQGLKDLGFEFRARVDYDLIEEMFERRSKGEKVGISKSLEFNFKNPDTDIDKKISSHIQIYTHAQTAKLEADLAKQEARLIKARLQSLFGGTESA
jgi:hypothetical protein